MNMNKQGSPAYELLLHVWQNKLECTPHSWERVNHAMRAALHLAIDSGMRFDEGDFEKFANEFRSGYWIYNSAEWAYALAVKTGNLSAAKAFESYKHRGPFIYDEVTPPDFWPETFISSTRIRKRGRLAVGFKFDWKLKRVTVTSFNGAELIACSYKPQKSRHDEAKIERRFKITVADLKAERKRLQEERKFIFGWLLVCQLAAGQWQAFSKGIERTPAFKTRR